MSPKSRTILTDATNQFKNGIRRMRSTQFDRPLAKGKENYPSPPPMPSAATTPPLRSQTTDADPHRWDPVNGMIVIKVSVPATDDIWRLRVAEAISLRAFRAKVELKVGFAVAFMDREPGGRQIVSEEAFRRWVVGRVRNGRNHPIIVVRKQQAFILNPSTPTSPLSPTLPTTPMTPITPTMPYMPTSNLSVWSP